LIKAGVIEKPIAAEDLVDEHIAKLSAWSLKQSNAKQSHVKALKKLNEPKINR
jgi:hypothetical protein